MVLPLLAGAAALGIGGLAGAEATMPHLQNRRKRIAGKYAGDVMDSAGPNADAKQLAEAGLRGGLMDFETLQQQQQRFEENAYNQSQANKRAGMAAGTAANRLAFDRERHEFEKAEVARGIAEVEGQAAARDNYHQWLIKTQGNPAEREAIGNQFTPSSVKEEIGKSIIDRATNPADPAPAWEYTPGEQQRFGQDYQLRDELVTSLDETIPNLDQAVDNIGKPSLGSDEQAAQIQARAQTDNYIRRKNKADTGGEMADAAFEEERQNYPMPVGVGEGVVSWMLRGERISNNAVKEFWREELKSQQSRRDRDLDRYQRAQSQSPPPMHGSAGLPEGWTEEN